MKTQVYKDKNALSKIVLPSVLYGAFELQRCPHHNGFIYILKKHFSYFWKLNLFNDMTILKKKIEKYVNYWWIDCEIFFGKNWPRFRSISNKIIVSSKGTWASRRNILWKTMVVRKRNVLLKRISPHCAALSAKSIIKA